MTTPTIPQILGQLIQNKAERFPDAVALRFVQAGHPDEVVTYEHDIVAAVVPTDRTQFDPTSIVAACRRSWPTNAIPSYLHVVSALPKTLSEKPQNRLLLERFDPSGPDVFMPSLSLPAWRHRLECLDICLFIGLIKH